MLKMKLKVKNFLMPKTLSATRWSARAYATKAIESAYAETMEILEEISCDDEENGDVKNTASGLLRVMCRLETGILIGFWHTILDAFI